MSRNEVTLDFKNTFVDNSAGLHHFKDPVDGKIYIYSHCEPFFCHRWFPCFDQPSVRAEVTMEVMAPDESWQIISNAEVASKEKVTGSEVFKDLGDSDFWLTKFEVGPNISSYIYNLCAGQFEIIHPKMKTRVPMKIYLRKSKETQIDAEEFFRVVDSGIGFYEKYTGTKYPWAKYDQIFCPDFRIGAMENVGAVTFNDMAFLKPADQRTAWSKLVLHYVALHELAHMWFGDLVTMVWWTDLWLKESFADFMAATCLQKNPELKNYENSDQLFL